MAKYMTKQRRLLLDCLSAHHDQVLTARQIAELASEKGISVSAIYRNLSALESDGLIKRISKAGSREAFYQYTDAPECRDCLHLSCTHCGKTYHMNSSGAARLMNDLQAQDGFFIDKAETVLYGVCNKCRKTR